MVETQPQSGFDESAFEGRIKLKVDDLTIRYGSHVALKDVSLDIRENEIFGIIGPANAGKTSFLKSLNRMDMFDNNMHVDGSILFEGHDIHNIRNIYGLRRRIGVVFPLPVGLPMTVYQNVALSPHLSGIKETGELDVIVEQIHQYPQIAYTCIDILCRVHSILRAKPFCRRRHQLHQTSRAGRRACKRVVS